MGSSGGSSGSSQTVNTPLTKGQYDPEGYAVRGRLLPKLEAKYDVGLTPQEESYYRSKIYGDIDQATAEAQKGLLESLARGGIKGNSGAAVEAQSDLRRSAVEAKADAGANIMGQDIAKKQQDVINLLGLISDSGMVGTAGSTTTTTEPRGSTAKSVLGGALGGGLAGAGLSGSVAALNPYTWPLAIGGAVLGGLGGLL